MTICVSFGSFFQKLFNTDLVSRQFSIPSDNKIPWTPSKISLGLQHSYNGLTCNSCDFFIVFLPDFLIYIEKEINEELLTSRLTTQQLHTSFVLNDFDQISQMTFKNGKQFQSTNLLQIIFTTRISLCQQQTTK